MSRGCRCGAGAARVAHGKCTLNDARACVVLDSELDEPALEWWPTVWPAVWPGSAAKAERERMERRKGMEGRSIARACMGQSGAEIRYL